MYLLITLLYIEDKLVTTQLFDKFPLTETATIVYRTVRWLPRQNETASPISREGG